MSNKGRLIIISAPSGTGKTTVVRRLMAARPHLIHSVSWTTRSKRPTESDGLDYRFVDWDTFQKNVAEGGFAEWANVHGNFYGTPLNLIEQGLKEGQDILLDIDVQGSLKLQDRFRGRTLSIFLLPPSPEELERRLAGRGTDDPQARKKRLENAKNEMALQKRYDYRIVNDDLEMACMEILVLLDKDCPI